MRNGSDPRKINAGTYMVGSAEFERKRVDHLLDLQLFPVSGPETCQVRETELVHRVPVSPSQLASS